MAETYSIGVDLDGKAYRLVINNISREARQVIGLCDESWMMGDWHRKTPREWPWLQGVVRSADALSDPAAAKRMLAIQDRIEALGYRCTGGFNSFRAHAGLRQLKIV